MSATTYELTVTLLTDLHAGSGLGGADVDAILERDARGLPTVRWTHLRGLLQQALVDRERALRRNNDGKLLNELFGTPIRFGEASSRGQVRGTSLRVTGDTAKVKVYSSTAREKRVPKDDTLRRVEYLQAETVLSGMIQVPSDLKLQHLGDEDKSATLLMETLFRRTDRLGKNRTRGDGRILLKVRQIEVADSVEEIHGNEAPVGGWQHYRLAFRALDPLCFAVTLTPGNVIPGTSFLNPTGTFGMLAAAALKDDRDVAEMLFDGRIEAGASYPLGTPAKTALDVTKVDAVPIPLSYQTPKPAGQVGEWPWWVEDAQPATPQDILAKKPDGKLKRPGADAYLVTDDNGKSWACREIHLGTRLRNNAGEVQRGFRDKKALFSQEEIPEDTVFVCHLRVCADDARALKNFESWLAKKIRQGDWLFAGRGGTPLQLEQACRVGLPASGTNSDALKVSLFFETDLIARCGSQTFHTQLDRECLADLFAASDVETSPEDIADVEFQSEPVTVHGFNVMTGNRRLPAIAVRRGSVAVLTMKDEDTTKSLRGALAPLQFQGLGERCAEGYGRFRLDFAPIVDGHAKKSEELAEPPGEEQMLHLVNELLSKHEGCLTPAHGFSTTRLHSLRHAARRKESFDAWFEATERAVKRAKKPGQPLLDAIKVQRTKAADSDEKAAKAALQVLERFALEAAKRVQTESRSQQARENGKKS